MRKRKPLPELNPRSDDFYNERGEQGKADGLFFIENHMYQAVVLGIAYRVEALVDEIESLRAQLAEASRDRDALQAELELERRKDHAHNAWKDGYNHAMADYAAGRTVGWPDADRARRALSPGDAE